jgi:mono/diheme cytochrome c family protein
MRLVAASALLLLVLGLIAVAALAFPFWQSPPEVRAQGDPARGEYVLRMGGCVECHTAEPEGSPFLAGGRALKTPFGTFHTPNITPDPKTGIGGWSTGDFILAMVEGVSPGGQHYFPAFPYTSYTHMSDNDLVDLKAYLDTVKPVERAVPAHELDFPYGFRPLLGGWKLLFFDDGAFQPDPSRSDAWNRGAYLVNGPGHCGECHTPRNAFGARVADRFLAGTADGPEGKSVPNITPHKEDGIGGWSKTDIVFALQTSILPDGDVLGGAMGQVVEESTSHLERADLEAIAEYLLSLEPVAGKPPRQDEESEDNST